MGMDFHSKPFDEGTKLKLSLFHEYIKEWLPVFLGGANYYRKINFFDFFCGPGQDVNGVPGSPMIAIAALHPYFAKIIHSSITVKLYFNEKSKGKLKSLKSLIVNKKYDKKPFNIYYSNLTFEEAFEQYYPEMKKDRSANFIFLDQGGVKQVTEDVFKRIVELPATDFLFFISSSTMNRFYQHPEICKYIKIPKSRINNSKYYHIHRVVHRYYKELIPKDKKYYLASFSIKKGPNIYGLIFGTQHLLGIDKFLSKCWKIDPQRGEANFDIDQDGILDENQLSFFPEFYKPKKLEFFEEQLADRILRKKINTNIEIYKYTLESGFLSSHSRDIIKQLIEDGRLPKQKIKLSRALCKLNAQTQPIIRFEDNG